MPSTYYLLNVSDIQYSRKMQDLRSKMQSNFTPRLDNTKKKALVQVKEERKEIASREIDSLTTLVLEQGDADWARKLVAGEEWVGDLDLNV